MRDVSFTIAVSMAALIVAPIAASAASGWVTTAGGSALVAKGTGTVAGLTAAGLTGGTAKATLATGTNLLEQDAINDAHGLDTIGRINWSSTRDAAWAGFKEGVVEGVFAVIGAGADKAVLKGVQTVTRGAAPVAANAGRARVVLQTALEHAIAGGASGAVIGALEQGVQAAAAGRDLDAILTEMESGFVVGGIAGGALGAGTGALEGAKDAKGLETLRNDQTLEQLYERGEATLRPSEDGSERALDMISKMDPDQRTRFLGRFKESGSKVGNVGVAGKDGDTAGFSSALENIKRQEGSTSSVHEFTNVEWNLPAEMNGDKYFIGVGGWTPHTNYAWMEGLISKQKPVILTHPPSIKNFITEHGDTAFFKHEIDFFLERGYRFDPGYNGAGVARMLPPTQAVGAGKIGDMTGDIVAIPPSLTAMAAAHAKQESQETQ